jgi:predicted negative regulator of RcsB-dependent stress response
VGNKSVQEVQVGAMHFNTEAEKDAALNKAMTDIAVKYNGSDEGATAEFYLASNAVDKGNLAEAEKRFKEIVDTAPGAYGSLAKLSLSRVYESEGKDDQAEKLLRDLIAHPSVAVSKDEAQLRLAALIGRKNPEEARKMLEGMLRTRSAISRAAEQALGELAQH